MGFILPIHDLGMGRIVGQMLIYLYFSPDESSLGEIGEDLGLSKASVSIAARQLESFGLLRRVWKPGDRKSYYRTSDNITVALQQGILSFLRQNINKFGDELNDVHALLEQTQVDEDAPEVQFARGRVHRARQLHRYFERLVENPLTKLLVRRKVM